MSSPAPRKSGSPARNSSNSHARSSPAPSARNSSDSYVRNSSVPKNPPSQHKLDGFPDPVPALLRRRARGRSPPALANHFHFNVPVTVGSSNKVQFADTVNSTTVVPDIVEKDDTHQNAKRFKDVGNQDNKRLVEIPVDNIPARPAIASLEPAPREEHATVNDAAAKDGVVSDEVAKDKVDNDMVAKDGSVNQKVVKDVSAQKSVVRDETINVEAGKDGVVKDGVVKDGVVKDGVVRDGVVKDGITDDGLVGFLQDGIVKDEAPNVKPEPEIIKFRAAKKSWSLLFWTLLVCCVGLLAYNTTYNIVPQLSVRRMYNSTTDHGIPPPVNNSNTVIPISYVTTLRKPGIGRESRHIDGAAIRANSVVTYTRNLTRTLRKCNTRLAHDEELISNLIHVEEVFSTISQSSLLIMTAINGRVIEDLRHVSSSALLGLQQMLLHSNQKHKGSTRTIDSISLLQTYLDQINSTLTAIDTDFNNGFTSKYQRLIPVFRDFDNLLATSQTNLNEVMIKYNADVMSLPKRWWGKKEARVALLGQERVIEEKLSLLQAVEEGIDILSCVRRSDELAAINYQAEIRKVFDLVALLRQSLDELSRFITLHSNYILLEMPELAGLDARSQIRNMYELEMTPLLLRDVTAEVASVKQLEGAYGLQSRMLLCDAEQRSFEADDEEVCDHPDDAVVGSGM